MSVLLDAPREMALANALARVCCIPQEVQHLNVITVDEIGSQVTYACTTSPMRVGALFPTACPPIFGLCISPPPFQGVAPLSRVTSPAWGHLPKGRHAMRVESLLVAILFQQKDIFFILLRFCRGEDLKVWLHDIVATVNMRKEHGWALLGLLDIEEVAALLSLKNS